MDNIIQNSKDNSLESGSLNRRLKTCLDNNDKESYREFISPIFPKDFMNLTNTSCEDTIFGNTTSNDTLFNSCWQLLSGTKRATAIHGKNSAAFRKDFFIYLTDPKFSFSKHNLFFETLSNKAKDYIPKHWNDIRNLFYEFSEAPHGRPSKVLPKDSTQQKLLSQIKKIYSDIYTFFDRIKEPDYLSPQNIGYIYHIIMVAILLDPRPAPKSALIDYESLEKANTWIDKLIRLVNSSLSPNIPEELLAYQNIIQNNLFLSIVEDFTAHAETDCIYETPQIFLSILKSDIILSRKFYWYQNGEYSLEAHLRFIDQCNATHSIKFNQQDSINKIITLFSNSRPHNNEEKITPVKLLQTLLTNKNSATVRMIYNAYCKYWQIDNFQTFINTLDKPESFLA